METLRSEGLNKFSLSCQSSPFALFTQKAETKLNLRWRLQAKPCRVFFHKLHKIKSGVHADCTSFLFRWIIVQVSNSHHQTCGASGWKWSKGTGCSPPRPSGNLSRFAGTASPPSDWCSRCSLEDRDAGAHLQGNSRHGFGSITLLKILRNYRGNSNISLNTTICFRWAKMIKYT